MLANPRSFNRHLLVVLFTAALSGACLLVLGLIATPPTPASSIVSQPAYWANLQGICALVATSSLMGSAVFALIQYSNTRHERHLAIYNDIFQRLMSNEHVEARRFIYSQVPLTSASTDSELERFVAELDSAAQVHIKLCLNAFDHLGFLVHRGWLDDDSTLGWINPIVVKVWERLGPLVEFERKRRTEEGYYFHCSYLARRCAVVDKRGRPSKAATTTTKWLGKCL